MYNPVSRFVSEIPSSLFEKTDEGEANAVRVTPWGNSYSAPRYGARGAEAPVTQKRVYYSEREGAPVSTPISRPAVQKSTAERITVGKAPTPQGAKKPQALAPGDRVRHMTFGEGEILSVKNMGADVLYEVMFDKVGTKKLMATYARLKKYNP